MSYIRVLLAEMPTLHADIVRRIVGEQPDMSIVGEVDVGCPVRAAVERTKPHVLLVGITSTDLLCACLGIVWDHPWLRVLAMEVTGRQGAFVEARFRGWPDAAWPDSLVEAIRHAAAADGDPGHPTARGPGPG